MMSFGPGTYGLGLLAGLLSTLSPCVLPLVPILIGSATNVHRRAPLALAAGLALSYAVVGTALAWAGASAGLDTGTFRTAGAVILGLLGLVLMSSSLQERFATATSGLSDAGNRLIGRLNLDGLSGQFVIGLVLGMVWSPCVGPTLGAAITLASQGRHLPEVAALMGLFGLGAALPFVVLAWLSRSTLGRVRGRLMQVGAIGKMLLGGALVLLAVLILSGADKTLETWVLTHAPDGLTRLTTRF